jgi:hypothetical protein
MDRMVISVIQDELRKLQQSVYMAENLIQGLRTSVCINETLLASLLTRRDVLLRTLRVEAPAALLDVDIHGRVSG